MISLKPIADNKIDEISILLIESFSLLSFASLIEPFRMANYIAGKKIYEWRLLSKNALPVKSSSGIAINIDAPLQNDPIINNLFVCSGVAAHLFEERETLSFLHMLGRTDCYIGGVCTGSYILARAGLLNDYRCTIHWENLDSFREIFPKIDARASLFEQDRNRLSCSGSTSAFEMAVRIIANKHGNELADAICEQFIHEKNRIIDENNILPLRIRLQINHPKLMKAVAAMEEYAEKTISRQEIADIAGISCRQLERLFYQHLGISPKRYYLKLRLERAKRLLLQTNLSIAEIAFACGFNTASHFSRCFRTVYGFTPRTNRKQSEINQA